MGEATLTPMHGSAVQNRPIPGSEQVSKAAATLGITEAELWALLAQSDQIAYNVREAAVLIGICERSMWALIRAGEVQSFRVGILRRISRDALLDYVKRRQEAAQNAA